MGSDAGPVGLIDQLARLLLPERDPQMLLAHAVRFAARAIDAADSVSVSLLDKRRRIATAAASDELARAGDELQYRLGEGPCLDAVWAPGPVHCHDLDTDSRWPDWARAAAARLDVRSTLSVPLATHERTVGSINFYARIADAFDPSATALADSVAIHTAVAHMHALDRHNLEVALVSRNLIGQAQGILMERHKITADRAFEVLVTASQQGNLKLVEIAGRVVDTGVTPQIPEARS